MQQRMAQRMPVLGLVVHRHSPVLGLAALLTLPARRVVWAGLIAPELTTPIACAYAVAHNVRSEQVAHDRDICLKRVQAEPFQ